MCRELSKTEKISRRNRLKHHGSPNGGLPPAFGMNFPGEAEGRLAGQGQTSRVAGAMRDADVRRVVPFTLERGYFGCCFRVGED
jgi:hypothetical protein